MRRNDRATLGLLIFCIFSGCWVRLLKTLVHFDVESEAGIVDVAVFYGFGVALVIAGIIIVVVAIILVSSGAKKGKIREAGVIMIGPIPIIFGSDKKSVKTVVALGLALTIVVLIITVVFYFLLR